MAKIGNLVARAFNREYLELEEISTPTALTNYGKFYTKTDNKAYFQDGAGTENDITGNVLRATGTYSGDNTANRAIPHGLANDPYLVIIRNNSTGTSHYRTYSGTGSIDKYASGSFTTLGVTAPDTTNIYVGNATSYANSANATGSSYRWVALG